MSLVLESKVGGDFKPHPEGIHPAVCVDVIDLGLEESEFQGRRRLVNKVRLVFETEQKNEEGKNCTLAKTFTASLNSKARLAEFLGKWRGRPVVPGERIDLGKLLGACCTLVISHQQNLVGRTYASIDAVSKPTKRVAPSGQYDPALARQRVAEWKAKQVAAPPANAPAGAAASATRPLNPVAAAFPQQPLQAASMPAATPKSQAEVAAPLANAPQPAAAAAPTGPSRTGQEDFDPEVGF